MVIWVVAAFVVLLSAAVPAAAQTERVVDLPTRPGATVRALIAQPATPSGSVILLAGGHGKLDIDPSGRIGWGRENQVVRTRQMYASAGFTTLLPDVASDLKRPNGVAPGYRWSREHAEDLGAMVAYLRTLKAPVFIVGTSRGALSVANAGLRLSGPARPDALVISSGMLMDHGLNQPSVQRMFPDLQRLNLPILLVAHEHDQCAYTPARDAAAFLLLLLSTPKADVVLLSGGRTRGDPCEANSYHGFLGLDSEVVTQTVNWLRGVAR